MSDYFSAILQSLMAAKPRQGSQSFPPAGGIPPEVVPPAPVPPSDVPPSAPKKPGLLDQFKTGGGALGFGAGPTMAPGSGGYEPYSYMQPPTPMYGGGGEESPFAKEMKAKTQKFIMGLLGI